ncbi:MAG: LytTR family DNA-binding domain-containing protein [Firmicutes bacterium]|nr:LytTR family DNA-binding domain-containing protein [Bacillota bacterium]
MIIKRHITPEVEKEEIGTVFFSIINNHTVAKVPVSKIELIEQDGRIVHIITSSNEYECYDRMSNIVKLLEDESFHRPIKSLLINLARIAEVSDGEIIMESGSSVILGKNSYHSTKTAFKKYLMEYPSYEEAADSLMVAESSVSEPE